MLVFFTEISQLSQFLHSKGCHLIGFSLLLGIDFVFLLCYFIADKKYTKGCGTDMCAIGWIHIMCGGLFPHCLML